ncbi:hypothetical protein RHMOL_Rhmol09G0172800 [Rhododendron molle]|uniref:Uncharacterized protein n=1 Tax=Rhododendron molle TaxID=49168 RepID=A0ACC0MG31_RHOML|nr:hypothetical protein RHMOL_Rhmol09G0172800 [Rhododendron molle]
MPQPAGSTWLCSKKWAGFESYQGRVPTEPGGRAVVAVRSPGDGNLARGVKVVSTGEEILDDVLAFRFGGRKSAANHFKRPKTTVETKGAAAGTSTDREGKGCLKSDNQKGTGRILLSTDYGVEASYYVSYDADYHAAMHHPPKNN